MNKFPDMKKTFIVNDGWGTTYLLSWLFIPKAKNDMSEKITLASIEEWLVEIHKTTHEPKFAEAAQVVNNVRLRLFHYTIAGYRDEYLATLAGNSEERPPDELTKTAENFVAPKKKKWWSVRGL